MENKTNIIAKFKSIRFLYKTLILIITIFTVGIPTLFSNFKSNIENQINKYGVYTLQEIQELNLDNPEINKISNQKSYYESYFSKQFADVSIEESISYLKSGISANYLMQFSNNKINKPSYQIQVWTDTNNKTTWVNITFRSTYDGDSKKSYSYIDKEELEYICNYYDFKDAYSTLETLNSKTDINNFSSRFTDNNNVNYSVYIYDHDNVDTKTKTIEYKIEKTY